MTWLVACEYSGTVRDALIASGVDAVSCDLLPTESEGPHIQGDVRAQLTRRWTGVIAHPPCTRLCNSGVRWLAERNLWAELRDGADMFRACLNANASRVAVENPVMHKHAIRLVGERPSFTVQPWQFGDPVRKRTCWWTRGLPPLEPTSSMTHEDAAPTIHRMPPGPERSKERARFFPGMARAIAEQWAQPNLIDIMEAAE
jgi:hypothetical protein